MKTYRPYSPGQSYLLPPSPTDWLPEGHLAYFVLDLVTDLDLGAIERVVQAKDARGERPYAPRMMTALLLYGYAMGVTSTRKLASATYDDVAFRVLAAGEHPHFTSIHAFRAQHRQALADLFHQVLAECMSAGLVKLGHVAIDGTRMKANASKHKAMSYDRMQQEDARLKAEIEAYMKRMDVVDAEEDELYGVGQAASDLPAELQRREGRREKIRAAREALKQETARKRARELEALADDLRAKAADPSTSPTKRETFETVAAQHDAQAADLDDDPPPPPVADADLPRNTPPRRPDGTPAPKAQRNFTDPESRIMVRDGAYIQAYNAQLAVDEDHQIIVAAALSNQATDVEYFEPMLRRVVDNCDRVPEKVTADAGYFSAANITAAEHMGTEPFIAAGAQRSNGDAAENPTRPQHLSPLRIAMRAVLESPRGRAAYARRKATVEPVIGQIRTRGIRQMSFRGLWKNRCEWLFVCATHNVLKLWRATRRAKALRLAPA